MRRNNQIVEPVLEICPISNQLLRYIPDIRNHPARQLMKKGIGCVIGNDDPQILGNPGLSYDFWEAYVGMELYLVDIKAMVFMAYLYSLYTYNTKKDFDYENAYDDFLIEWNEFVDTTCAKL
jgi:adenosine deaminase CECR1